MVMIIENDFKIAYSDLTIKELKHIGYTPENINVILSIVKPGNLKHIHIHRQQLKESTRLAKERKVPKKDALHAIIARDNDLQLIATDLHFEKLKDIINTKKPEDFI